MAINKPTVPIANSRIIKQEEYINGEGNAKALRDSNSLGVFAEYPFMSPKYARHRPDRHHEFEDTMARMFIPVSGKGYEQLRNDLADPVTKEIVTVLAGNDAGVGGHGYIDFLLQNATHEFEEKVQIVETLSDSYVAYFFGHAAPIFQYQGTLLNSYQDDWAMNMFRIFRDLGRGTQLARRGLILYLRYDSLIVAGAMLNFRWSLTGGEETHCPFGFSLLVKRINIVYGSLVSKPTQVSLAVNSDFSFEPPSFSLTIPSNSAYNPRRLFTGSFYNVTKDSEETKVQEQQDILREEAGLPRVDVTGTPVSDTVWGEAQSRETGIDLPAQGFVTPPAL